MKKATWILGIATLVLVGCNNGEKKDTSSETTVEVEDSREIDSHNARTALDWAGVYEGTTPCLDCDGIETTLRLKSDETFELSQNHLGKPEGENDFQYTGNFTWKENGSEVVIETNDKTLEFKIEENQVRIMNIEGDVVDDELADFYVLEKTSN